jgi:signal transduction histidine kinase
MGADMQSVEGNESARLAALRNYRILDTPPEASFDSLVRLASSICETPVALITLVDEARQWFKARVGLKLQETERESSFCAYATNGRPLTVTDTLNDERFRRNPLVIGPPNIRFYAGIPLVTPEGLSLGAMCVIDSKPRAGLTDHQRQSLELLSRETMLQLELRRAAFELAAAKASIESQNSDLEAFGAAVAHDLRAPVRVIDGFSELLVDQCKNDGTALQYVNRIRTECATTRDIIDALLRLSRASLTQLSIERVDLSRIAREAADELHALEPQRTVQLVIQSGISVNADAGMMRLVLFNLLNNAWKATRSIAAARVEFGASISAGRPEYFVRDNGCGFAGDEAPLPPRAFNKKSESGVGLGLTIVDRIVRRHGGALRAESVKGKGATFAFTLG